VAAGVLVLVMPVVVGMLMGMHHSPVAVLMAVMAMGLGLVPMLMLVFVFIVAAHSSALLSL